jgi:hypothetical protein
MGWPQTVILLISDSQVVRVIGMSHWQLAFSLFLKHFIEIQFTYIIHPFNVSSPVVLGMLTELYSKHHGAF